MPQLVWVHAAMICLETRCRLCSRCAFLQSLLSDKSAEVVGENFLAISPTVGVPEPDFVEMPAEAPAQAAAYLASPLEVASQA